jgi:DNA-binding response OmpR family regulator
MGDLHRSTGVLVVEDNDLVAATLEAVLLDLGFCEVYLAPDLSAGRTLLQERRPGLGVLDVNIGRTLVFPLAQDLREQRIPIVFATALQRDDFPSEWLSHPIVPKPFSKATLVLALHAAGFDLGATSDPALQGSA